MSALVTGICLLMIVYMVYRIIVLLKRNKANKKLISLVNSFNDEQAFFAKCEQLTGVADPEMAAKAFVIQFWGAVRAKKYDLAAQALERLKIGDLLPAKEKDAVRMHRPYKLISGGEEIGEGFSISVNPLLEGFSYPQKNLQVLTAAELFEIRHKAGRYETKFRNAEVIHSYQDLEPQDYVVHEYCHPEKSHP